MTNSKPDEAPRAVDAFRERIPEDYERLTTYATCVADELSRLEAEDPELAPADLETMFTEPPEYDCPDTMGIIHFMRSHL